VPGDIPIRSDRREEIAGVVDRAIGPDVSSQAIAECIRRRRAQVTALASGLDESLQQFDRRLVTGAPVVVIVAFVGRPL